MFFRRILPCLLAVTIPACAASAPSFLTAKTFPTGTYGLSNTVCVATSDFNGDGHLDLVVVNQGFGQKHVPGFVAVLLGNGDGTFQPAVEYTAGGVPDYVALGDFNKDGKIDLVVANSSSNNVSILLGNGDGTFQTHMDFGIVNAPASLIVGDFNNDGNVDVASTDADLTMRTRGSVAVLLGNGDGTLQPAVSSPAGGDIQYIAAGDFNGDGILDLAAANRYLSGFQGSLAILFGNGDGTFQSPVSLGPYSQGFVVAADFNQDGNLDLATDGGQIFLGKGDGTFDSPIDGPGVGPLAVGDLNGDGKPDLVTLDPTFSFLRQGTAISVYYGVGDGTFQAGMSYYSGGADPSSIAIGDFNGDRRPDLAVTNQTAANVAVILAKEKSAGQFRTAPSYLEVGQFTFADFNGDHFPDMAAISNSALTAHHLQTYAGNGDGTFKSPRNYSLAQPPNWVVTGDFNNDGKVDVAVGVSNANCVNPAATVMLGNGDGTFGSSATYSAGGCTTFIAAADVNGDGNLDLITLRSVLLGNGDGTFQNPIPYNPGSAAPTQFVVGDFNGDGKLDLVGIDTFHSTLLTALLGNGDGTFQPAMTLDLGNTIYALAAADLNGDGKLDVVVSTDSSQSQNTLIVLLGNGDGTFRNYFQHPLKPYGYGISIADLNRDGKLDVAVVEFGQSTGQLLVFLGNGNGTLQAPSLLNIACPTAVATPDLNQDGVADVVVLAAGATVFINSTP